MDFTHVLKDVFDDGTEIFCFYYGQMLCSGYHEGEMTTEWKQLAFILEHASKDEDFICVKWHGGRQVLVEGLDTHKVFDLDCKLISYQLWNHVDYDSTLELKLYVEKY